MRWIETTMLNVKFAWDDHTLTICTSSCLWGHSAAEGPSSRCDSWCRSHRRAAAGQDPWPAHRLRTRCTPGSASPCLAPPCWSVRAERDAQLFLGRGLSVFLIGTGPTQSWTYLYAHTVWMVALATLGTGQQTALCTQTKAPTDHTHVLKQPKHFVSQLTWQAEHSNRQ